MHVLKRNWHNLPNNLSDFFSSPEQKFVNKRPLFSKGLYMILVKFVPHNSQFLK